VNKEESKRLKMWTEERLDVAQAKENYWKLYRGRGNESKGNLEEGREMAWQHLEKGISAIEGGESWRGMEENDTVGGRG
jgi:hypothetical protein